MLYSCIRAILRVILLFLGLKIEGINNIPPTGPVIVAANHVSIWDPIVVGIAIDRPVHFIAKSELFKNKILGKLLLKLNAFPVKRGSADKTAFRTALKILEGGNVLGIFPEGSRNKLGEESKPHHGVAMFSIKTGAAVIPIACIGTRTAIPCGWFKPFKVKIGKPLYYTQGGIKYNNDNIEAISNRIMMEINNLFN
ncbi:MAG: lysophospholipid acyltransferase family protein [Syntrophomonadaceae bacterium]|jgi:1-acyl-sn-glycerol-3-phosphate acyltransferase